MNSSIHFVELDNRVIEATYRNLMIKATVVLVDKASGRRLPEPVTTISSKLPADRLRIRLPAQVMPGIYVLEAFNAQKVAHSGTSLDDAELDTSGGQFTLQLVEHPGPGEINNGRIREITHHQFHGVR